MGRTRSQAKKWRVTTGYQLFRKRVLQRDGFTCRLCGKHEDSGMTVHHLIPMEEYPQLRKVVQNGITLCDRCHKMIEQEALGRDIREKWRSDAMRKFGKSVLRELSKPLDAAAPAGLQCQ